MVFRFLRYTGVEVVNQRIEMKTIFLGLALQVLLRSRRVGRKSRQSYCVHVLFTWWNPEGRIRFVPGLSSMTGLVDSESQAVSSNTLLGVLYSLKEKTETDAVITVPFPNISNCANCTSHIPSAVTSVFRQIWAIIWTATRRLQCPGVEIPRTPEICQVFRLRLKVPLA